MFSNIQIQDYVKTQLRKHVAYEGKRQPFKNKRAVAIVNPEGHIKTSGQNGIFPLNDQHMLGK